MQINTRKPEEITPKQLSYIEGLLIDIQKFEHRKKVCLWVIGRECSPSDLTKAEASKMIGWLLKQKEKNKKPKQSYFVDDGDNEEDSEYEDDFGLMGPFD